MFYIQVHDKEVPIDRQSVVRVDCKERGTLAVYVTPVLHMHILQLLEMKKNSAQSML
jgi:hypothetical protein